MKKSISMLLVLALLGGFVFASGSKEQVPAAADALKIAIVSSPSGVDDGSFNEDNYNGILSFVKRHPASTVTPVREPTGDSAAAVKAASDIVADYDVEVCTGF
ncbi:MAG: BMP family ABC transporter substrate-binding protein, partial [Sphaerochaetaceae bacterium]